VKKRKMRHNKEKRKEVKVRQKIEPKKVESDVRGIHQ
jgi:hypothetical protein